MLVEPVTKPDMEIRTHRLRKRVVGCVPDQQVTEAVTVVARDLGTVGTHELAPNKSGEPGRHLRLADATGDPQLGQRVAHLDRRTTRPQCIVLVRLRDAEHRHHGVADELLDGAAVSLDDRLHLLEVACEQRPQRLGIGLLSQLGRAAEVAEQDGHRLADFARG